MMNPKAKGPGLMVAIGVPKNEPPRLGVPGSPKGMDAPPDHEATETPEQEGNEEYGAKLLNDLTEPLTKLGMADEDARSTAADMFEALAKCLRGGSGDEGTMGDQYADEGSEQFGGHTGYGQ